MIYNFKNNLYWTSFESTCCIFIETGSIGSFWPFWITWYYTRTWMVHSPSRFLCPILQINKRNFYQKSLRLPTKRKNCACVSKEWNVKTIISITIYIKLLSWEYIREYTPKHLNMQFEHHLRVFFTFPLFSKLHINVIWSMFFELFRLRWSNLRIICIRFIFFNKKDFHYSFRQLSAKKKSFDSVQNPFHCFDVSLAYSPHTNFCC